MKEKKEILEMMKENMPYDLGFPIYEEKIFTCIGCGRSMRKIVYEETDNSSYFCPSCELGDLDFDDD
ncbi:hypothetical protein HOD20_07715 [archaeon]|jgi:formamidopyrimidine-DNA glycosylase|nr:hypothetical protein [archaeon]MBT4352395.1 hypothetical protein [archaeon]MBT4648324.1 hypothetical protein [archaeon]MBT6822313.1 hypothetical protein [archaeon]MBT7391792.1 hypothetical protein [archaeon]